MKMSYRPSLTERSLVTVRLFFLISNGRTNIQWESEYTRIMQAANEKVLCKMDAYEHIYLNNLKFYTCMHK